GRSIGMACGSLAVYERPPCQNVHLAADAQMLARTCRRAMGYPSKDSPGGPFSPALRLPLWPFLVGTLRPRAIPFRSCPKRLPWDRYAQVVWKASSAPPATHRVRPDPKRGTLPTDCYHAWQNWKSIRGSATNQHQ